MKSILLLALVVFLGNSGAALAQGDTTEFVYGIPVTEDDTVQNPIPADREPKENLRLIKRDELPSGLRKALEKRSELKGWEKKGVYHDVNTDLYIVTIPLEGGARIFGLDKDGKGVTYDEIPDPD